MIAITTCMMMFTMKNLKKEKIIQSSHQLIYKKTKLWQALLIDKIPRSIQDNNSNLFNPPFHPKKQTFKISMSSRDLALFCLERSTEANKLPNNMDVSRYPVNLNAMIPVQKLTRSYQIYIMHFQILICEFNRSAYYNML